MKLPVLLPFARSPLEGRRPLAAHVRVMFARLVWVSFAVGILGGLAFVGRQIDFFARRSEFFRIEDLHISGASPVLDKSIRALIGEMRYQGEDNLLLLGIQSTEQRIVELPRVRRASVRKEFPHALRIEIEERMPLVAAYTGTLFWIDEDGVLLGPATPGEVIESGVPLLTGLEGSRFYPGMRIEQPNLLETLAAIRFLDEHDPELGRKFDEWNLTSTGEVIGILNHGVEVRFGDADPAVRLPVLASILETHSDLDRYTYFDLRFGSKVFVF